MDPVNMSVNPVITSPVGVSPVGGSPVGVSPAVPVTPANKLKVFNYIGIFIFILGLVLVIASLIYLEVKHEVVDTAFWALSISGVVLVGLALVSFLIGHIDIFRPTPVVAPRPVTVHTSAVSPSTGRTYYHTPVYNPTTGQYQYQLTS